MPVRGAPRPTFTRLPAWLISVLGLNTNQLPNEIPSTAVVPTLEIFRPDLRLLEYTPDPAAAGDADVSLILPDGYEWELLSFRFRLDTDANVANRLVQVQAMWNGVIVHQIASNFSQAAGVVGQYCYAPVGVLGQTSTLPAVLNVIALPAPIGLRLPAQGRLRMLVHQAQAGDQLQGFQVLVRAHPIGAQVLMTNQPEK